MTQEIENHFIPQEEFNRVNACKMGLPLNEYVQLNSVRVRYLSLLEKLIASLTQQEVVLPVERIGELGQVLREGFSFAINNRLFEDATRAFRLIMLLEEYEKRKN